MIPQNPERPGSTTNAEREPLRGSSGAESKMNEAKHEARRKSHEITDRAKQRANQAFDQNKGRAAHEIDVLANALRSTASNLHEQEEHRIENVFDRTADTLDRFSSSIRNRDMNEIIREAEMNARRHPQAFLGAAAAIGFLAARFLKASREDTSQTRPENVRYTTPSQSVGADYITYGEE